MIGALKAAFLQGRLTEDELGVRADRVYASRTYAELAEVIADLPTALTGARSPRAPWRATKRAWCFEYAAFLPGIAAVILLPGGPHTTIWTLITWAAVLYPVFWTLGVVKMVAARRVKASGQQLPPMSPQHEQVIGTLKAALAQGCLTEDEHDARAALASAARSRASWTRLPLTSPPIWPPGCRRPVPPGRASA